MQADEEIRLVVVGHRGALIERHAPVLIAGEEDAHPEPSFDDRFQPPGDCERQLLLRQPAGAGRALVFAAMTGVDRDRPDGGHRLSEERQICGRKRWRERRLARPCR